MKGDKKSRPEPKSKPEAAVPLLFEEQVAQAPLPLIQTIPAEKPGRIENCEEKYLRLQAEFQNYRRRVEKEKEALLEFGGEHLLLNLLPLYEELKLAAQEAQKSQDAHLKEALNLLQAKMSAALREEGLEEMKLKGERFDPAFHEAAFHAESDAKPDTIIEVIKPGYLFKGKILRHAMVGVAKKKGAPEKEEKNERKG